MKRIILFLSLCMAIFTAQAQMGQVPLSTYIPEDAGIPESLVEPLTTRINAMLSELGMSGAVDGCRFVVVPRLQMDSYVQTPTAPSKIVAKGTFYLYVGDAMTGALFSSCSLPVKGVGNTDAKALSNILHAINARNPKIREALLDGMQRIVESFNQQAPAMIAQAKALMEQGNSEQAIGLLYTIPSTCSAYEEAMQLAANFGNRVIENENASLVAQARAAWSAQPDEEGAAKAAEILAEVDPSTNAGVQAKALSKEIATRLNKVADQEMAMERQRQKDAVSLERARINANAATEKARQNALAAYYRNRPRVVYHVHWW